MSEAKEGLHGEDSALLQLLAERYGLDTLERHAGAIYVIDADWRLCYMNAAWTRFAEANDGAPAIASRYTRGSSLLDAFATPALREFYAMHYTTCRDTGRLWRHEYDCSSSGMRRLFQQLAYPLPGGHLLIVNSRLVEAPELPAAEAGTPSTCLYRDAHGLIHQCAHCRRVCAADDDGCWDWVPDWAREIPTSASHTFCPTCAGFYYPPHRKP